MCVRVCEFVCLPVCKGLYVCLSVYVCMCVCRRQSICARVRTAHSQITEQLSCLNRTMNWASQWRPVTGPSGEAAYSMAARVTVDCIYEHVNLIMFVHFRRLVSLSAKLLSAQSAWPTNASRSLGQPAGTHHEGRPRMIS